MDYLSFVLCLLLAWVVINLLSNLKRRNQSKPRILPPGPPKIPVFGNLFSLGTNPHISVTELAKTYGPLMTLQLGQVTTVVVSSVDLAKEVLQKNDIFFCNRFVIDAFDALNHQQSSLAFMPVCPAWRKLRKISNSKVFSASKLNSSQSLRKKKVTDLLDYVQKQSEAGLAVDIGQVAFTTTLNLLSNTIFSVDLGDPNSGYAGGFRETVRGIMEEMGKPNFADYFPLLKKIDPQGIRRRQTVNFGKLIDLFETIIDQRLQGKRPPGSTPGDDVLDALLGINQENSEELELEKIPHLLLDLFGAGTDTTSTTLEWALAELIRNPEKLTKAQAELQEIIGKGNPVEESDIAQLPYLQAIIKETFRLHPPTPFLVPRKVDADVKLYGYTVPQNAQVLVNVWAIGREPNLWENPNSFEPERFIGSKIDVKSCDFELIPFGAGRRICPGLSLAHRMIHLMLGSLIHSFDWKLEGGIPPEKMDMEDKFGITLEKAQRLRVIPALRS
ncbi:geraniol 8-hydroxylase-like [Chenopodium quinoa]|uniref:Cytochrome P450 76AD1-like protein n=1 Tax=Chenopodium quinoa TaxID=63459 RepID=A0A803M8S7_CHEQI|nr:geraniol 8-hydroxylase-like [Chenopodium quinoa]